jgi:hypothetical protein
MAHKKIFMKKLFPLMVFALAATMFTSCKKDYSCTCTVTVGGVSTQQPAATIKDATKKDAKSKCSDLEKGYTSLGATASCSI